MIIVWKPRNIESSECDNVFCLYFISFKFCRSQSAYTYAYAMHYPARFLSKYKNFCRVSIIAICSVRNVLLFGSNHFVFILLFYLCPLQRLSRTYSRMRPFFMRLISKFAEIKLVDVRQYNKSPDLSSER